MTVNTLTKQIILRFDYFQFSFNEKCSCYYKKVYNSLSFKDILKQTLEQYDEVFMVLTILLHSYGAIYHEF